MTDEQEEQIFIWLDAVRDSGVMNMFGATPYIAEEFDLTTSEARKVHARWMESFGDRHPHVSG